MCVAVPYPIVEIVDGPLPMARVQRGESLMECCLAYVPDAQAGDYVLVQNGFAIEVLDAAAAAESLAAFAELGLASLGDPDLDERAVTGP